MGDISTVTDWHCRAKNKHYPFRGPPALLYLQKPSTSTEPCCQKSTENKSSLQPSWCWAETCCVTITGQQQESRRVEFSHVESERKPYRNMWELMAQLKLADSTDIKTAVRRHYPGFPAALWLHKKKAAKRKEISSSLYPQGARHEVMVLNWTLGELS